MYKSVVALRVAVVLEEVRTRMLQPSAVDSGLCPSSCRLRGGGIVGGGCTAKGLSISSCRDPITTEKTRMKDTSPPFSFFSNAWSFERGLWLMPVELTSPRAWDRWRRVHSQGSACQLMQGPNNHQEIPHESQEQPADPSFSFLLNPMTEWGRERHTQTFRLRSLQL